uniref:DUF4371 domain-containing protein n=1 Tax=Pelodiscus sinensis TaxID=13735 RepID=K7GA61_PELSI
ALSMGSSNENFVLASYEVSKLIAEIGYLHIVGERLILPALNFITYRIYRGKKGNQLGSLSLSNNTVKRRIEEMVKNIEEMLIHQLQNSQFFALQLDESTDIADSANVMCFVRYDYESSIQKDLLFCKPLPTKTTAAEIFKLINEFIIQSDIDWKKCVGLSSDEARPMAGSHTGLVLRFRTVAPDCVWVHCSSHREALVVKTMPSLLSSTLQECVKFINYIKARPLNSRIFTALCNELGSEHEHLLLHCEIRWLSKGLFEMKDEVLLFLEQHPSSAEDVIFTFKDRFHEFDWLTMVAYLCDIFCLLNYLSLILQGTKTNILKVHEKVEKLRLWAQRVNKRNFKSFCTLTELQEKYAETNISDVISAAIKEHLLGLTSRLNEYFPPIDASKMWIKNLFTIDTENEEILQVDSLIELSCDSALKENFDKLSVIDFWLSCRNEYSHLSEKAVKFLMPFVTMYKCESSFSSLVFFKNKYRNRLNVESDLRIKLSSFAP